MTFPQENVEEEFPPIPYIKIVAEHCPRALCLYIKLWEEQSSNNTVVAYKDEIRHRFFTTITRFKNDLMAIVKEGLISVDETPSAYHVELVSWD